MHVLHVNSGNIYGGIETLLLTLGRFGACCPEMKPGFALCFDGRLAKELRQRGQPVHLLGAARFSRPWTIWRVRRSYAAILRELRPDVVICHSPWSHAIFAPVVRRFGIPLAFWAHGPALGKHWLERWANRTQADLVIANSQWTREHLRIFRQTANQILYYPVADDSSKDRALDRHAVRAEIGASADAVVIVQVSRLEAWKGHVELLGALAHMRHMDGWECWIVGGPQRPAEERYLAELKALAASAGIAERVRFLGQRQDVPRVLAAADIHCQPNRDPEPFGITFVEALYSGLPVVTTLHGGAREILSDDCALLVPPGDSAVLVDSMRRLIANGELRNRLGAAGAARARALCDPRAALNRLSGVLGAITPIAAKIATVACCTEGRPHDAG